MSSISKPCYKTSVAPGSESSISENPSRWPYFAVGAGAFVFFYLHLFHFPFVPLWHDGGQAIYLEHAERMLHGSVLYRDLFQFNLPGTEYLYYFMFRCFGVRLWVPSLAMLVTATAVTLLVYTLSRMVLRGAAAFLPALAFLVICQRDSFDGSHHWYSTLLVLLAVYLIGRKRKPVWIGIAGALLATASLFTSSRGASVALGICLFFAWKYRDWRKAAKAIAALLAPFAAVIAAAVSYLSWIAGPGTLYQSVIVFSARYYSSGSTNNFLIFFDEWNSVLPFHPFSIVLIAMWLSINVAVPVVLIAFFVKHIFRKPADTLENSRVETLALYAFAGSFAFLAVASSLFTLRLNCAAAFAYIVAVALLQEMGARRMIGVALTLAGAAGIAETAVAAVRPVVEFHGPRGPVAFLSDETPEQMTWLAQNARPGDLLFGDPLPNAILGLENPSRLQTVESDAYTRPEQVDELIRVLNRTQTRFIYWFEEANTSAGKEDNLQPLRAYLNSHYHLAHRFSGDGLILELNSSDASKH